MYSTFLCLSGFRKLQGFYGHLPLIQTNTFRAMNFLCLCFGVIAITCLKSKTESNRSLEASVCIFTDDCLKLDGFRRR